MVSARRKKAVDKTILFPLNKNSDSTSPNERFVKNTFSLHTYIYIYIYMYIKLVENGFQ